MRDRSRGGKSSLMKFRRGLATRMLRWLVLGPVPAVFCLAPAAPAAARDWTIPALLLAAETTHPAVAGRRADQAAAQAGREAAGWQRFPTPSVAFGSHAIGGSGAGGLNGSTRAIRLDQPLWTGGRIAAGIDAADHRLEAANVAINETRLDLRMKVAAAASEALHQQERLRVAQGHVAQLDKLLGMIRRRVKQEVSAVADLNLAQSRKLASLNDVNSSKQALRTALVQLEQLVGEPVSRVRESRGDEAGPAGDKSALLARTLDTSPRLQRLRYEEQQAEAMVRVRRSALSPEVLLRLENVQGAALTGNGGTSNRALLVVQWQIGAGLSAMSGVSEARSQLESVRQARASTVRDVTQQFESDWTQWIDSRARLAVARQIRDSTAEVADSFSRQYVAGRKSWLDMMNSVREVEQAELASVDVRYEVLAAALRLRLESGTLQ
jgi:adhesin transport system outer membrane protein